MADRHCLLLGCGILHKEVSYLIEKNGWRLDTDFLDSSLHVNFEKLACELQKGFLRNQGREVIVFYGCCHPQMEEMLATAHTFRTEGQNCIEMLLGPELFTEKLSSGAFFMLEDWALRWDDVITKTFGNNPDVVREIFQQSHRLLLCLRTPCSGDFGQAALEVGEKTGLPVQWLDVDLGHLERVLLQAMERKLLMAKSSG